MLCLTSVLTVCVPDLLEQGLPGSAKHESTIPVEVVRMQLYLSSLLHQMIHISLYLNESANVVELHAVSCISDVFCYSCLLWLVQVKVPHVLFVSHFYTAACLYDRLLPTCTWHTVHTGKFSGLSCPWVV